MRSLGIEEFRRRVEAEWEIDPRRRTPRDDAEDIARLRAFFDPPAYRTLADTDPAAGKSTAFRAWYRYNTAAHKVRGYRAVFVSLKKPDVAPGDITDTQMELVADLADRYSFGEVRVTHTQNLLLADVEQEKTLRAVACARGGRSRHAEHRHLTDMICCPGLDFCSLANAGSIDVAKLINERFDDYDYVYDLGELEIKMSGCMNACGHHHVGHIGILGVDKGGQEWYQITIGGAAGADASLGQVIGPSVAKNEVAETLARLLEVYVEKPAARGTLPRHGAPPRRQAVQRKSVCRAGCCVTAESSTMIGRTWPKPRTDAAAPLILTWRSGRTSVRPGLRAEGGWAWCCHRLTGGMYWRPTYRGST